ncbi:blood vessel epicardial substance-like isoform X1 [Galleria mellonella]|uniref:Blood vessel epicardial substance-like isoform X1 n=1 Tax=Galleria mellonella TaxID=7137 RepID=A0ABM3MU04_GALME|nr:blood vessel epicardial substance-like isoform X1 [Galleria mellonella]
MLFLGALTIGMITGLQNVTTDLPSTGSDVTEVPESTERTSEMGLLETTKLSGSQVGDFVNVTIQEQPSMWELYLHHCPKWRPINHIFFQVANIFFLLSFLAPHTPSGLIWLRVALIIGCAFSGMWAWSVECYLDGVLWNSAFIVINFVYFSVHFYLMKPIKFHKDIEEVYVALFKPLRVSRRQFRRVLMCMRNVRHLKCHELYAHEKVTKVDSLSLVLSGKLVVSQNQRALHIVFPHHFLDSPEWFGVSTDEYFQVSIMAMEESRVLVWHRDKLKLSIMSDGFLQAVFDHILGRDVVHKLMQVSETMAVSNGHLPNSYEEGEDKPMLVVKKAGDGPGITALLNRQLQGEHAPLLRAAPAAPADPSAPGC